MNWKLCLCLALLYIGLGNCDEGDDAFVTTEDDEPPSVVEEEIAYASPSPSGYAYLADHFDDLESFKKKWVLSEAKKDDADEEIAKYDGEWAVEAPVKGGFNGDLGLVLKSKAKHAAISSRLKRVFEFKDKPLVVQYEVILQEGQECGGAYLKLLSDGPQTSDLRHFHDKTPYTIMFGPDKCGFDHKLHFIFRHRNPLNGTITEKHAKAPKERLQEPFSDKQPHLYTLVLKPDNTFQVSLDHKVVNEGSLLEDFSPAVNPAKEIDDPNDRKPEDWDEREKIPDPQASKPEDWDEDAPAQIPDSSAVMPDGWLEDEEESIPDPNAEKPEDWDTEMDGDWEAPLVSNPACEAAAGCGQWRAPLVTNPAYKGKWRAPLIENPNYKGRWSPRRIPNPDHFEDKQPFRMTPISAVGLELWSMSNMILFDNFLVTDDPAVAEQWAADSFDLKRKSLDKQAGTMWGRVMRSINYKPGWWALYFVYCMIPISIYVWYISRRVKEETFVSRIIRYTNEQPWLWAVYVIVLAIPVVLIFVFCCGPSAEEKEEQEREAEAKKTDAVSPDDEVEEEEQEEEEEEVVEKSSPRESSQRESSQRGPSRSKSDLDQPREEAASVEEEVDAAAAGDAPRSPKKRRPRKE